MKAGATSHTAWVPVPRSKYDATPITALTANNNFAHSTGTLLQVDEQSTSPNLSASPPYISTSDQTNSCWGHSPDMSFVS